MEGWSTAEIIIEGWSTAESETRCADEALLVITLGTADGATLRR